MAFTATRSTSRVRQVVFASAMAIAALSAVSIAALAQDDEAATDPSDETGAIGVDIVSASEGDDDLHRIIIRKSDGATRIRSRTAGDGPLGFVAPTGSYQVEVSPADGWTVTGIECSDGTTDEPSIVSGSVRYASVQLTEGEDLVCTVTVATAQVTLAVKTEPESRRTTFDFDVIGWLQNPDTGASVGEYVDQSIGVLAGSSASFRPPELEGYVALTGPGVTDSAIGAAPGDRWEVEDVDCDAAGASPSSSTRLYHFLEPGAHVTCTWTLIDQTVPSEGPWVIVETSATMDCPRTDRIPDPKPGDDTNGRIKVRASGDRLILTGAGRGRVVMKRISDSAGEYRGKRGKARIRWSVVSPERVIGVDRLPGPERCRIQRTYQMTFDGS